MSYDFNLLMDIKHPLINIYLQSKTLIVDSDKNKLIFPRVTNLLLLVAGTHHKYWWTGCVESDRLNALAIVAYTDVIIYSSLSQELRKCPSEYVHFIKQCSFHRRLTPTADFYPFKPPHKCRLIPSPTCELQLARQDAKIMCNNEH